MISRHKDSNTINFLENALFGDKSDQELLGKNVQSSEKAKKEAQAEASELQATGFSREDREEQSSSDDGLLGISRTLLERTKREELQTEAAGQEVKEAEDWREAKPARKLDNNESVASRFSNAILSAGVSGEGGVSNNGGSSNQHGGQTQNSIFDPNVLDRIAKTPDNKEKTAEEKQDREHYQNSLKQERLDSMIESLSDVDTRKDATVTNVGEFSERSSSYKLPKNNISMFDDDRDFSRVPEKTDGEIDKDMSRAAKVKDDSWKRVEGTSKRTSVLDNLFDQLGQPKKDEE